jgi:hypothetical protein
MTTAAVRVQDDTPSPQPVTGMVIQFFTTLGVFVTQGTTDGAGSVTVSLPDGTYNVLFYKQGVSILPKQPQQIVVSALAASNNFLVTGHVSVLPESPDPLRCRISGQLVGPDGLPTMDQRLSFLPQSDFSVSGGNLVSVQRQVEAHPDDKGYFQFDLLRGMKYTGSMLGIDSFPQLGISPVNLQVIVPALPALSLVNLLFPLPVSVIFSQDTISIPLAGGPDGSSTLGTITYSDGSSSGILPTSRTPPPPFARLDYVYSDPTLFSIVLSNNNTVITPLKTGTGTVQLVRTVTPWAFWPEPPSFVSPPLTVTIV